MPKTWDFNHKPWAEPSDELPAPGALPPQDAVRRVPATPVAPSEPEPEPEPTTWQEATRRQLRGVWRTDQLSAWLDAHPDQRRQWLAHLDREKAQREQEAREKAQAKAARVVWVTLHPGEWIAAHGWLKAQHGEANHYRVYSTKEESRRDEYCATHSFTFKGGQRAAEKNAAAFRAWCEQQGFKLT